MFTMKYHRASGNTTEAAAQAIALLKDPGFKHAVFSASPWSDDGTATAADGPETNWPYFAAAIRVDDAVHIFDSTLLNAARMPRDREVRQILDVAQTVGNVHLTADDKAYFTGGLTPEAAAQKLTNRQLIPLDAQSRVGFWNNLARGVTEAEFDRMRAQP
jgi:hypothetical protein